MIVVTTMTTSVTAVAVHGSIPAQNHPRPTNVERSGYVRRTGFPSLPPEALRGPAQLVPRRPTGLDDGRLRLLHRGAGLRGYRQGFPRIADQDGLPDHGHADHAPGRCVAVRPVGRPDRPPYPADGRRLLLLDHRLPLRVRAQLLRVAGPA